MLGSRWVFAAMLIGAGAAALWLFALGGSAQVSYWAAIQQREVQTALASALRALRAGEPGAILVLLGLCFSYGFFHAAGPGHGKLVMGGYALAEEVPRLRLLTLTLAGSLGQAVTAIVLVYIGVLLFGWGRSYMTDMADKTLASFSAGAIVLVGVWLVWRGVRRGFFRPAPQQTHGHDHSHHSHGHDHACCGHSHGPEIEDIAQVTGWRDGAALVLAVAIRPCTGALFVLLLTYGMGIWLAGILGAIAMALGTAILTVMVALGANILRGGMAHQLDGATSVRVMAVLEICVGLVVVLVAGQTALRLLG